VPKGAESQGTQHADPIFTAVAQLHAAILWVVLPLDKTKDGSLDRMADVWGHERVTVAPAAEFRNGLGVVGEPMSIKCVAGPRLESKVERVHDPSVEKGFPDGGPPMEARAVARVRILWIDQDERRSRIFGGQGI
jgi:hypothetical protein